MIRFFLRKNGLDHLITWAMWRGHPASVIDLSFAFQFNAMIWMAKNGKGLKPAVYEFPKELDRETALMKLETMGIKIDKWTEEQERYARAYAEGT